MSPRHHMARRWRFHPNNGTPGFGRRWIQAPLACHLCGYESRQVFPCKFWNGRTRGGDGGARFGCDKCGHRPMAAA